MTAKNTYTFFTIFCVVGWGWLIISFLTHKSDVGLTVCMSKHITDIPCPSCGTTRSVVSFFEGDFVKSLYLNPLGILASLFLLIAPLVLLYDLVFRKTLFYQMYIKSEEYLKKAYVYIPLIFLILLNWIWNIQKGL
ncbi:DUF2752 domain-containing protein [Capnocytophaga stomatis]|uniref:DUF2752 domain-containing protein n=1 Tax=Capnocytophaga stomatis TaxID=1848904 RepID=UPI00385AB4BA